ncbi:MAG TPA: helix-turn-helix transcriptional regulator [Saprospiraceae bacterium]|nr:helix-turn-helix transcriptional regulator [Saprospiraceae bacterium]
MSKIVTWSTPKYSESSTAHETDSLFFADDIIRYWKFRSPFSIKFCLEDAIRYVIGNQSTVVPPGGFFIANDGLEMECLPNNPGVKALIVFFTNDLIFDVNRNCLLEDKTLLDSPDSIAGPVDFFEHVYRQPHILSHQLRSLAQQMAVHNEPDHNLAPDVFYSLAENLFSLQWDTSRQIAQVNARSASTREELFRRVLHAKEWMHDHWNSELRLEQISHAACMSPYHFHRSFREAFGQSPMKWLCQLKLQKAKKMLETGGMSVTQVAFDCGYTDVFSFSKAFKRELGVSPSAVIAE